jgi:hypothetical protein
MLVIVAALARASYGDPLAVETVGELPFSKAELGAALSLRAALATATSPRRVEARVVGEGNTIRIEVTGRAREVALDGQRGVDAARLVAFAILDLAGTDLDPPEGRVPAEAATPALEHVAVPRPTTRDPSGWSIAVWAVGGTRTEAMLESEAPLTQHVRLAAAVGGSPGATHQSVTLRSFPVRLSLAVRVPATPIELRAGTIALVEHAAADRAATDVNLGASAAVIWHARTRSGFALLIGAGGDAFATALAYQVNGMPIITTDRYAWWAGAALGWEPAP